MRLWHVIQKDVLANTGGRGRASVFKALLVSHSVKTIVRYRLSHALLHRGGVGRVLSKWFWLRNIRLAACHISPRANIGPGLRLPHAVGIVIGEGVVIGEGATIYQHVTLGTSRSDGTPAYPAIGDGVRIYANAVIFGPITVGHRVTVGAGLVVSKAIPDDAVCRNDRRVCMDVADA